MRFITILLVVFSIYQDHVFGEVLWATKVVSFSSQYSERLYRVEELLYHPNVFPNHTLNGCSWSPAVEAKMATVEVGFAKNIPITQIAIFINQSPSALSGVSITDNLGSERRLDLSNIYPLGKDGKIIRLNFPKTPFGVHTVKVYFNLFGVKDMLMVDALGISDDSKPIEAEIALVTSGIPKTKATSLPGVINTVYDELNPFFLESEKKIVYSRKNSPQNSEGSLAHSGDIYVSSLENNLWTNPQNFSGRINNVFNNEIVGITADEKKIYVLGYYEPASSTVKQGISYIVREENGNWKEPKGVKIADFYSTDTKENTFYLHPSEKYLLMSLDRKEGLGKTDLYLSFLQSDGTFSSPTHLGPKVNSAGFEFAPFLSHDLKRLYFSSYGFSGYGGADIYVSERIDESWNSWTTPLNLGPEINSPKFDAYIRELKDGSLLFSSTRQGSLGYSDFFILKSDSIIPETIPPQTINQAIETPTDSAKIYPQILLWESKNQDLGEIKIELLINGNPVNEISTYDTSIQFSYPIGVALDLVFSSPALPTQLHSIVSAYPNNVHKLSLGILNKETAFSSENILFERDASVLLSESFPTLDRMANWIKSQPDIKILIAGHTEVGGNRNYNLKLSLSRAEAVKNYLIQRGVSSRQLVAKGFGGSQPLSIENTPESRSANRRVEFTLLP